MQSSSKIVKNAFVLGTSFYRRADQSTAAAAAAPLREEKIAALPGAGDLLERRIPGRIPKAIREQSAPPPDQPPGPPPDQPPDQPPGQPPDQPPGGALPDREEIVKKWAEAGYAEGKKKAELECRRLREEASRHLQEAAERLAEARRRYREIIAASEQEVVRMAVAAAESLLRCQLDLSPEKILQVVRHTIRNLPGEEAINIYVNPTDLPVCLDNLEALRAETDAPVLEIGADETLARGSCRGETESSIAEYFLEEERERMAERLREVARREEQRRCEEADSEYARH